MNDFEQVPETRAGARSTFLKVVSVLLDRAA